MDETEEEYIIPRRRRIGSNELNTATSSSFRSIVYFCQRCEARFDSDTELNIHMEEVHLPPPVSSDIPKYTQIIPTCRCNDCGRTFADDSDYEDHSCHPCHPDIDSNVEMVDNIPTDSSGEARCPICSNIYTNQNLLGEHFILAHSTFTELQNLDETVSTGYPGINLLIEVGMVDKPKIVEDMFGEPCSICYGVYRNPDPVPKLNSVETDVGYTSTPEAEYVILRNSDHTSRIVVPSSEVVVHDMDLLEVLNVFRDIVRHPVQLTCCSTSICEECINTHTEVTNNLVCPFCKHDHEIVDRDYIVDYVLECDREKWIDWWWKHLDILY